MTSDGLVTASYAADERLLGELRATWPPGPSPFRAGSPEGFVPLDIRQRPPDAAIRLHDDRFAVALIADGETGAWLPIPLAGSGGRWWRAGPGDGLSAFVAGVPMASERALGVDQTNTSVVVGERAIVKWFRRIGPEPSRAATLIAHLDWVGFRGIPQALGSVSWVTPHGTGLVIAQGDALLPGARDGWEWVVERVELGSPNAAVTGRQLGELIRELHEALRMSSRAIARATGEADPATAGAWRTTARALLDDAVALTASEVPDIRALEPAIRADLDRLPVDRPIAIQPVHGDLHVGQVLEWSGGLAVIDFDGNPALGPVANAIRQPIERDVAQILSSLDHVGRIVERRGGDGPDPAVGEWIHVASDAFLAAYGAVDLDVLAAFEAEQECRELVYAARFLPRWTYAPLATLDARYSGRLKPG